MTWFKVDDSFHSHPKVLASSPASLGLWVVAGAWSSANLTEGYVPDHVLPRLLPDSVPLARELAANGLWRRERGGYRFHDWIAYNPTRSEATTARDKMASGGAIGNHRRWHAARGVVDTSCAYCQRKADRPPDRVPDGIPDSAPNPPTRPDPAPSSGNPPGSTSGLVGGAGGKPRERGTRLPEPFEVSDSMREWAAVNAPGCGRSDHEAFTDYWRSVPGQKGRKVDWPATWRNWMRKEHERRASRQAQNGRRSAADEHAEDALARGRRMQTEREQRQRLEITHERD